MADWAGHGEMFLESEDGMFAAEWVNLDEGWSGYYDPENPDDQNLLRFDCFVREDGEWVDPRNASYCTRMPAETDPEVLKRALFHILNEFKAHYPNHKRTLEQLSWIEPDEFKEE